MASRSPSDAPYQTTDYKIAELLRRIQALEAWQARVLADGAVDLDARTRAGALEAQLALFDTRLDAIEEDILDQAATTDALETRMTTAEADIDALQSAGVSWSQITDKPATFPPSDHGNLAHTSDFLSGVSWADITGKPALALESDLNTLVTRYNAHQHAYDDEKLIHMPVSGFTHDHYYETNIKLTDDPNN